MSNQNSGRLGRSVAMLATVLALLVPAAAGAEASAPSSQGATVDAQADATLQVFNRDIIAFRSAALGVSAPDRARRAKQRIQEQLATPGAHQVSLSSNPLDMLVQIDGASAFIVTADDADKLQQETVEVAAQRVAAALTEAIEATRESRSLESNLRSVAFSVAATAVLLALLWAMRRTRLAVERWGVRVSDAHAEHLNVSGVRLIQRERLVWLVHAIVSALYWLVALVLVYEWVSLVFAQFPYTRVWSVRLTGFLIGMPPASAAAS